VKTILFSAFFDHLSTVQPLRVTSPPTSFPIVIMAHQETGRDPIFPALSRYLVNAEIDSEVREADMNRRRKAAQSF